MLTPMYLASLVAAACLIGTGSASALPEASLEQRAAADLADVMAFAKRATPQAPNGYTPAAVNCPSQRPSIRSAAELSPQELAWLPKRRNNTIAPMRDLLKRLNITGFDTEAWMSTHATNASALPNIGIAFSGGGYRAMLNGAGNVAAFDSRTRNSTAAGHLGGLLQSATYIAGLSGGNWLVGSLYVNNFTSVQAILDTNPDQSGSLWQLENSILSGPATSKIQVLSTAEYWNDLVDTVSAKADAGFNTSITDYWSRALSYQLVNASNGGPSYTFSSIQDDPSIVNGLAPLPFSVAVKRNPGEQVISLNSTVIEFNPWEMGTFDPTVFGFAPLRYVGSNFSAGVLPSNEVCISGFDNAAFVMGTSSSLFNTFLLNLDSAGIPKVFEGAIASVLTAIGDDSNDIADWSPNPFFHYNNDTNLGAQEHRLTLVDGGEDLQNIPLYPMIQPERSVDVIFAVDSSADTLGSGANWPNGTAMVATYERSLDPKIQNGTAFPAIPDINTFVNEGLNNRPTFFGCDSANLTGPAPLIVYIPNSPYSFYSNYTTFTRSFNISERNAIIQNGYNVATRGNGTVDPEWPACVGCAILSRSLERTNTPVPDICNQCFQRYCWDGTRNSTTPAQYQPSTVLVETKLAGVASLLPSSFMAIAMAVGSAIILSA